MTILLDLEIPRTLDLLVERLSAPGLKGSAVEAWVFENAESRAAAEDALSALGVSARIGSAYKPLLHALLPAIEAGGLEVVTLRYPVCAGAAERRFLAEAYPLAALLPEGGFTAQAGTSTTFYEADLRYADGRAETRRIFVPNVTRRDALGRETLSPCAWLRISGASHPELDCDEPVGSDLALAYDAAMSAVTGRDWGKSEPFFARLRIEVWIGGVERPLPFMHERMSTREALHEDLYFSLLEWFQHLTGRPEGDRTLRPGQIIPDIRPADGPTRVRVSVEPHEPAAALVAARAPTWDRCEAAPPLAEAYAGLAEIAGAPILATSRQGREVRGVVVEGSGPPVLLTGGQHANETSGVVGALRAGAALASAGAAFALIAVENPDGYALHQSFIAESPEHMHHAARYTALGDDLEYRTTPPLYEQEARNAALAQTGAQLHINLHGYPAHEWTRPLNGYLPRGFDAWALPKGFFLILRHHAGIETYARALLERLTAQLARDPDLVALNRAQIAAYEAHAGPIGFPILNGIACALVERPAQPTPLQLITEYPDETIHGDAFKLAHRVQMNAALFARAIFAGDVEAGRWPVAIA
ncbi:peptidase M14 [Alsobacter metallidurans]|uniref:Peptidase M14 n=1 Tax=Alsobacter metallidurans TaxID=340221 RepID=A0A917MJG1_9HYPH|nr:peptidase M14 [Alsobacter metallidurans]GGH28920.1 peptidase M14 [Alsobacter metallidurans]